MYIKELSMKVSWINVTQNELKCSLIGIVLSLGNLGVIVVTLIFNEDNTHDIGDIVMLVVYCAVVQSLNLAFAFADFKILQVDIDLRKQLSVQRAMLRYIINF